jgi:hypothetical protein
MIDGSRATEESEERKRASKEGHLKAYRLRRPTIEVKRYGLTYRIEHLLCRIQSANFGQIRQLQTSRHSVGLAERDENENWADVDNGRARSFYKSWSRAV